MVNIGVIECLNTTTITPIFFKIKKALRFKSNTLNLLI